MSAHDVEERAFSEQPSNRKIEMVNKNKRGKRLQNDKARSRTRVNIRSASLIIMTSIVFCRAARVRCRHCVILVLLCYTELIVPVLRRLYMCGEELSK